MATGGYPAVDVEAENYKSLCGFRELFSGRFTDAEAATILTKYDGDITAALNFVLLSEPAEVRRVLEADQQSWTVVVSKMDRLKTRESQGVLQRAMARQIDTSARLFACAPCDHFWWKRVPDRKNVSKCSHCNIRYDAIPRGKEWGIAQFQCPNCQNEFSGYCGIWQYSPCYKCQTAVKPSRITPPSSKGQRRSKQPHSCHTIDCSSCNPLAGGGASHGRGSVGGRFMGRGGYAVRGRGADVLIMGGMYNVMPGRMEDTDRGSEYDYDVMRNPAADELPNICVHPTTRRNSGLPIVIVASVPHDSTGSTVNTFLPQEDISKAYEDIPMPVIEEEDAP